MMNVRMPDGSHAKLPGTPICFDDEAPVLRLQPPLAGEHTDSILATLGYTPEQIAALRVAKLIL